MCGIAGILRFDREPVGASSLYAMASRLQHRGPDGRGILLHEQAIGLAHTRLEVIDLVSGDQPMRDETERLAIAFNGEIYNYRELRDELHGRGHQFRTRSDTEVILAAYAEWGERCVEHLDGMFAFGLWDSRERRLLLARDRVGKKPLFVYRDERKLVFASELKAILTLPDVDAGLDPAAFPLFLTYGYVPTPRTFHRRITKLEPATTLTVRADGTATPRRYWDVRFGEDRTSAPERTRSEELRALLTEAVSRRLVSDVPVGAFLSGGLDSTIVVGLMSRLMDRPVPTFSIGFSGDASYDETAYARLAAKAFGTDHTELIVGPDSFDLFDDLIEAYDEPFADSSAIPMSIVSRLARSKVTVALSGDGGDELFAGYARLHAASVAERVPLALRRAAGGLVSLIDGGPDRGARARAARLLSAASEPLTERYLRWIGIFPAAGSAMLARDVRDSMAGDVDTRESFDRHLAAGGSRSTLARLMTLNLRTYLLDDLLVKADRCSMMHSLEVRSPFLDTALIEFAARLPDRDHRRGVTTKALLRRTFGDLVPNAILARRKMGFGIPIDLWFRTRWRDRTIDRLCGRTTPLFSWLDPGEVSRTVVEHMAGRANHGHRLWALLTLDRWLSTATDLRQSTRLPA